SKKFATIVKVWIMSSGSPSTVVKESVNAVIAVDVTGDTRSRKAAARMRVKENRFVLMNDQFPTGAGGAAHILSSASCKDPTKPVAANTRTPRATRPVQPCG